MTLAQARRIVRAKYPLAFGWRQFSVSDYVVVTGEPGGEEIASAHYATHAWILAAQKVAPPSTSGTSR